MVRFPTILATLACSTALAFALVPASAQTHNHAQMPSHQDAASSPDAATLSAGEVKKVDKDTGTLTIEHGPLVNLKMPGMTMVFDVADPSMLRQVKVGDQIRFRAEDVNGALTVTKLELAH